MPILATDYFLSLRPPPAFLSPEEYRQVYSEGQININLENKLEVTPNAA